MIALCCDEVTSVGANRKTTPQVLADAPSGAGGVNITLLSRQISVVRRRAQITRLEYCSSKAVGTTNTKQLLLVQFPELYTVHLLDHFPFSPLP